MFAHMPDDDREEEESPHRFKMCQRVTVAPPMRGGEDTLRGADAVVRAALPQPAGPETLYEIGVVDTSQWTQKELGLTYRHKVPSPDFRCSRNASSPPCGIGKGEGGRGSSIVH